MPGNTAELPPLRCCSTVQRGLRASLEHQEPFGLLSSTKLTGQEVTQRGGVFEPGKGQFSFQISLSLREGSSCPLTLTKLL